MLSWLVNQLIKFILHILLKLDASELEQVPSSGPLLLVMNHVNFLDAPVIITHLIPRPITGFVKKETWDHPITAFLFNLWGGIPIDRSMADFAAFKLAKKALNDGMIVAVAPEGTRTEDGRLIQGKPGLVLLASQCNVPIMSIAYYGHEDFRQKIRQLKRTPMKIRVGRTFKVKLEGHQKSKQFMQDATDAIMLEVADLLPKKYHGTYAHISIEKEKYLEYLD